MSSFPDENISIDPSTLEYLRKCSINLSPEKYEISTVDATVMVLDIRGFTGLCSRIDEGTICEIIKEFVLSALEISLCSFCDYVKTLGDGVMFISEGRFDEVFDELLSSYRSLIDSFRDDPRLSLIDGIGLSVVHGKVFKYEIPAVRGLGYKDYFGTLVNLAFRLHEVIKVGAGRGGVTEGSKIVMPDSTLALLGRAPKRAQATSATLKGIPEEMSRSIFVVSPEDFEV
jgi:Adenylate cyclase, family 3 (some proteins contain HAMP domain)